MSALNSDGRLARRDEGATRPGTRQGLARRVADLCHCDGVARRSKIHEGYSPSSRLAAAPNLWQRTRSLFMRWVPEDLPLIFNLGSNAYARVSNRRCFDAVCTQRFERFSG